MASTNEAVEQEAKHTPGPWERDGNTIWSPSAQEEGAVVAWLGETSHSTKDADGALIAAAPDLLEALGAMVDRFTGRSQADDDVVLAALAALARARGER